MPKCQFCGTETDVIVSGASTCEQCAADRELARCKFEESVNPGLGKPDKTLPRNGLEFKTKESKGE